MTCVRIGCFSAFWGDTSLSARQLVESDAPRIDYLVGDYLAEITMVILARKQASGSDGFVNEFVSAVWKPLMARISERRIRVVTNAGGLDPRGLKAAIERACAQANVACPRVAAVCGDDLRGDALEKLQGSGELVPFEVLGEREALWGGKEQPLSCNAYLGAFPIARALDAGAQIVVTGRCVDSALVLGPLIHEFGWRATGDFDRLSAGSLVGHIVECGAQATGGNFTDWRQSNAGPRGWREMGFPIAECAADGSFVLTKPRDTGGLVSRLTVAEQLVYEIGDAASYILPDVICDWRHVQLEQVGEHRVLVRGARGRAPPEQLKVCATVLDGFQAAAVLLVPGDDAAERARAVGDAICVRANMALKQRGLPPLLETQIDALGAESLFGGNAVNTATREVVLRVAARHATKQGVEQFVREVAPAATGMAPGITGVGGGQAHATPCVRVVSCLVPRRAVPVTIEVGTDTAQSVPWSAETTPSRAYFVADSRSDASPSSPPSNPRTRRVPLHTLCVARSGDKGDTANIGVVARDPRHFELIGKLLSAQEVQRRMAHVLRGQVARYPMPGLSAYNFVCTRALGGAGGTSSLACDRQGKSYAQQLLCTLVDVPEQLLQLKSNL
jgi:hypothetical protein